MLQLSEPSLQRGGENGPDYTAAGRARHLHQDETATRPRREEVRPDLPGQVLQHPPRHPLRPKVYCLPLWHAEIYQLQSYRVRTSSIFTLVLYCVHYFLKQKLWTWWLHRVGMYLLCVVFKSNVVKIIWKVRTRVKDPDPHSRKKSVPDPCQKLYVRK